jgi:hypothetical protein
MLNFIKKNKSFLIIGIIILIFVLAYLYREYKASKEIYTESYLGGKEYIMIPKTYGINEYSPMIINDEQMAKIYLNDYIQNMYSDTQYAYTLIDEEYRLKRFGNFNAYADYVNTLKTSGYNVEKYYVEKKGKYKLFWIYDQNDNLYIFKVEGVMQYKVYLDDSTVEI